jgi:hypothetical protein
MGTGKNLNLFWENFYRKINLLIGDMGIQECPKHGFFVWQILAIWRGKKKGGGCESYKRFLLAKFTEKKEKKKFHIY